MSVVGFYTDEAGRRRPITASRRVRKAGGGTRTTKEQLHARLNYLNEISNQKYALEEAYGGWSLEVVSPSGGHPARPITQSRLSAKQMLEVLNTLISYSREEALMRK